MATPYIKAKNLPQIEQYVAMELDKLTDTEEHARYLDYRIRYEDNPTRHIIDGFPPCLQIEPTSICNYRCTFCYQTDETWTKSSDMGMMTLDLFKRAIDEAQGQCEAVTIASRGEPLLHPQIGPMISYASDKFVALKLNTNGSRLTEGLCHTILQTNMNTLVISADAAKEPAYSLLRVRGHLNTVLNNVRRFAEIRDKDYPKSRTLLRVSGVKVPGTPGLEEMQKVWGAYADQVCFVNYCPWENTYERPTNDIIEPCSDLWRRIFLWWDGTVNPCDVDYRSLLMAGKFPYQSLASIWTGDAYTTLRLAHLSGKRSEKHPCRRCTVI